MEIYFSDGAIKLDKELNPLDEFVLEFTSILDEIGVEYVIVSGYVSILFGRNRTSEDVDLIVESLDKDKFVELWGKLQETFECLNTESPNDAYDTYLIRKDAIRFSNKGRAIPNMEFKFPKTDLDKWTLENKKEVILNGHKLYISPMELQISFKLLLGSEKDIEDALYLHEMFKDKLDAEMILWFCKKLNIEEKLKYLQ